MSLKTFKPYTPSLRKKTSINFSNISKNKYNILKYYYHRAVGRNNQGKITCRHKGAGHKKLYRLIDFKRKKLNISAKILSIEYDPYRSSFISLISYKDNTKNYILTPENLKIGQEVISSFNPLSKPGNACMLKNISLGEFIHNIEIYPGKGGQLVRAAGTFATVIAKEKNYIIIKLPSKITRLINENCFATIGKVGNGDNSKIFLGKAGRSRWLGIRPTVRGAAMNPIDHPHGGGEGKSPIGKPRPLTPWGKPALGKKTRNIKKNPFYIFKKY